MFQIWTCKTVRLCINVLELMSVTNCTVMVIHCELSFALWMHVNNVQSPLLMTNNMHTWKHWIELRTWWNLNMALLDWYILCRLGSVALCSAPEPIEVVSSQIVKILKPAVFHTIFVRVAGEKVMDPSLLFKARVHFIPMEYWLYWTCAYFRLQRYLRVYPVLIMRLKLTAIIGHIFKQSFPDRVN